MSDPTTSPQSRVVGASQTKDMPLTAELKDRAESSIQTANRIHGTLHGIRDRLFGTPPSPPSATADQPAPYSFSETMRGLNSDLRSRLADIEELADQLSARL